MQSEHGDDEEMDKTVTEPAASRSKTTFPSPTAQACVMATTDDAALPPPESSRDNE
jgi:hypothetical protein